ncbi:sulfotransferase family protein [Aurantiacibacter marinus]|uniref:Sulfotransferase family protein n=1 Tax=Aurantiacibacter marinus TaxID=874156 RepID=A0A0H0XRQ9_9SPHN|nr:sulfotransferase family protein [Aurantiacibacter marinus]KLI64637.1 hypothetical protein AAV99_03535 [Aurantiacibacter marinus]
MTKPDKVFCIGFQKTGTSSMRDALQILGYRVKGVFGRELPLKDLRANFVNIGLGLAAEYDAVEDMPWPLMYKELDAHFPGAKFILTLRKTDKWYQSIAGHFGDNPYHIQQLTYGEDAPAPVGHEERYCSVYERHNSEVLAYFKDRPADLLVIELEKGDGWAKLGDFLGVPVPDGPFVRINSSKQRQSIPQRIVKRLNRMGMNLKTMDG